MSVILIATGEAPAMAALRDDYPTPLLPLMDRPFIQHVVEYLVAGGGKDFHVVLSHLPQRIEELLGDGSRWGCRFQYHLLRDESRLAATIRTISQDMPEEPFLLADASVLPRIDLHRPDEKTLEKGPVLYCIKADGQTPEAAGPWTGWAWLTPSGVDGLAEPLERKGAGHPHFCPSPDACTVIDVPDAVSMDSYSGILDAHRLMLEKRLPGLLLTGNEVEEGIWLSRNVVIHPAALIIPPVYVAPNCRIGKGVRVGPYAVIGQNCVLDERSVIAGSVVFPNTYIGYSLEVVDAIIDRNRFISERHGSDVIMTDSFILGDIRHKQVRKWLSGLFSRCFALVLLVLAAPILPLTLLYAKSRGAMKGGPEKQVVKLPAAYNPALWKTYSLISLAPPRTGEKSQTVLSHFFLEFIPGLFNVLRGDLQIIGVKPCTREEILARGRDWQTVYLKSKAGLITESIINFGPDPDPDEVYSAEMLYSTTFTRWKDLQLLGRYFRNVFREAFIRSDSRKNC